MYVNMPRESYKGELPPLDREEESLRDALKQNLEILAGEIGDRNYLNYANLKAAEDFLSNSWKSYGFEVKKQIYEVNGQAFTNLEIEILGSDRAEEIVVIGAHYDSVAGCPGANDNGSGAVGVLELARLFSKKLISGSSPKKTLRFVQFVNEEPPFYHTEMMGSLVYAKACKQRKEKIVGMLSIETIGYYTNELGSQKFPFPLGAFYPSTGNYIAFIGNAASKKLVETVVDSFRQHTQFPSEGAALSELMSAIGMSDHWSFWQNGYPALMVTDTAPFRYPYYHRPEDTPDRVCYGEFARVVSGLEKVINNLVS
ncbi:putative aminopeptidase [Synechococcus sp. PCC 7502]|nr:putative aminopeptidase [Synechococcus sp. PCC 7502]